MAPETQTANQPTPRSYRQIQNAHQRTEAIKAAIELSLFSAIAAGDLQQVNSAGLWRISKRHANSLRLSGHHWIPDKAG